MNGGSVGGKGRGEREGEERKVETRGREAGKMEKGKEWKERGEIIRKEQG